MSEKNSANNDSRKLDVDIAIVGGGIAGLYYLYRYLKEIRNGQLTGTNGAKKVCLYESCDHVGGRIETWSLKRVTGRIGLVPAWDPRHLLSDSNFNSADGSPYDDLDITEYLRAEFGPMRIEPRDQPLLRDLLADLHITEPMPGGEESLDDLIPFFHYTSNDPEAAKFRLTGEEAEQTNIVDLLLLGIRKIFERLDPLPDEGAKKLWLNPIAQDAWDRLRKDQMIHRPRWKADLLEWINHLEDYAGTRPLCKPGSDEQKAKSLADSDYYKIRQLFTIKRFYLWDMGFWNLMSDVLSHYAVVKIRDWGSYYHFLHENLNAAEWLVFWLKAIKGTTALRGIRGGMSRMIHALLFRICELNPDFSEKVIEEPFKDHLENLRKVVERKDIKEPKFLLLKAKGLTRLVTYQNSMSLHHKFSLLDVQKQHEILTKYTKDIIKVGERLESLRLDQNQGVSLKFEKEHITANNVVLALPKLPLDNLELPDMLDAEDKVKCGAALRAVQCLPLLKCFFIIKNPWWSEDRGLNSAAADVPTREITYTLSKDKTRGMIMIYTDHPAITFWSEYLREFEQAEERNQYHHTVWWKDRYELPPSLDRFDNCERWKNAWKGFAKLWSDEHPDSGLNSDDRSAVENKWSEIARWWSQRIPAAPREQHKELEHKLGEKTFASIYLEDKQMQQDKLWCRFVQFARDYEHHDFSADDLLACGMHDWGKEPFGAAAHGWLPGERSWEHMKYLAAFPGTGNENVKNKICVVGEAYSDYQGFIEGSLRSAEMALKTIEFPRE